MQTSHSLAIKPSEAADLIAEKGTDIVAQMILGRSRLPATIVNKIESSY